VLPHARPGLIAADVFEDTVHSFVRALKHRVDFLCRDRHDQRRRTAGRILVLGGLPCLAHAFGCSVTVLLIFSLTTVSNSLFAPQSLVGQIPQQQRKHAIQRPHSFFRHEHEVHML